MAQSRYLMVVADDFGIGPETDRGILDAALDGHVTSAAFLVNSPYSAEAVAMWNRAGRPFEMGWHPALTIDRPILPADRVPTLVCRDGKFRPLGQFVRAAMSGKLNADELRAELAAQHRQFVELVGAPPPLVNSHQHVAVFPPVAMALHDVLSARRDRPFVRRVREPLVMIGRIPGARIKRAVLNHLGRRQARALDQSSFPGCDWLAGITNPVNTEDPRYLTRWLSKIPGRTVELMVHPGHHDTTLIGRDCTGDDEWLTRRVRELELLRDPDWPTAIRAAGFELVTAAQLMNTDVRRAA